LRAVARRRSGFAHDVEIEGGHQLVVDEPVEAGGENSGPTPSRLVAAALAGCVAVTMEMYAERKGWDIGAVEVSVDFEFERHVPTDFEVTVRLPDGLSDEQHERLLKVAEKCPVHKLIAEQTPLKTLEAEES
jgi:putative redox protein